VEGRCSILNNISITPYVLARTKDDLLAAAELGELLVLLIAVCDPVPGEGDGERIVAQCFETDDEDDGTPRLVLMGGVYSMRRDEGEYRSNERDGTRAS
jgi:hypothetical protein